MRRVTVVLAMVLGAALPAAVQAGGLEFRVGGFVPKADSGANNDLFRDHSELYTVGRNDWEGWAAGLEYSQRVAPNVELGLHVDAYDRSHDTNYRDYTRSDDREIFQTLKLSIVPVGVTVRLVPTGRRVRFAPYLAAGADLIFYRYEAFGDFIDFGSSGRPISSDDFVTTGVAPGFHVAGGFRIPFKDDFAFTTEVRYQFAEDEMGGDFSRNRIDLSGFQATVGLRLKF